MNSDDPLASTSNLGMCELDMHTSHCLPLANSIIDRKGMGSRAKCTSLSHKNVTIRKKNFPRDIAATDIGKQRVRANPARDVQQHIKFLLTLCATWCAFTFISGPPELVSTEQNGRRQIGPPTCPNQTQNTGHCTRNPARTMCFDYDSKPLKCEIA